MLGTKSNKYFMKTEMGSSFKFENPNVNIFFKIR